MIQIIDQRKCKCRYFDTAIESGAVEEQNADNLIPLVDKQVGAVHNDQEIEGGIKMSHGNRKVLATNVQMSMLLYCKNWLLFA